MDWFTQAIQDVGNAISDGVEAVGDAVEDVVETVVNFVEDTAEVVVDTVEAVVNSTVGFVETVVDVATGERDVSAFGDWAMNTMDDLVFDQVDYITGGAVDVGYDDGQFTAGLDFGIGTAGVSLGQDGFSADASFDIGIAQGDMSYNSAQGFAASGTLGIDWGPLPTVEGHLSISPEGDVLIGGELQASLPGLSLEAGGDFYQNADGSWGASGSLGVDVDLGLVQGGFHADGSVDAAVDGFAVGGDLDASFDGPLGAHGSVELGGAAAATLGPDGVSAAASTWGNVDVNGAQAGFQADGSVALAPDGDFAVAGDLDAAYSGPLGSHGEVSSGFQVGREDGQIGAAAYGEASGGALGAEGVLGGAAAASAGRGHLEVDVDTWGDSEFQNVLDPSVLATDSGLAAGAVSGAGIDAVSDLTGMSPAGLEKIGRMVGDDLADAPAGPGMPGAEAGTPEQLSDREISSTVETDVQAGEPVIEIPDPGPPDDYWNLEPSSTVAPPADDFSADLAAADQAGAAADDIWEGMETSEG